MKNTLFFSCPHVPFEHKDFLSFIKRIYKYYKCERIVCLGDLVDNHSISYHEHDPDGWAPADEMKAADKHLKPWFKAFPKMYLCWGNHDHLPDRKGKTVGLPKRCFRSFREMWKLPDKWLDAPYWDIDDVHYEHGEGYSGKTPHLSAAIDNRMHTVIGHWHSVCGVENTANSTQRILGASPGCGIDIKKYAFAYGKGFRRKPIVGCGVISTTKHGTNASVYPMDM